MTDRDSLDAEAFFRFHGFPIAGVGAALAAHHAGQTRTVDVRVQQTDGCTFVAEREGQVDRRGRFTDAPFPRRDRDRVLNAGQRLHAFLHRMRDNFGR